MPETKDSAPIGHEFPLLYDDDLPPVEARLVARIAGVAGPTINVWIGRGILPGVKVGTQGRARSFDASLVFHLAVISTLVRLGYTAHFASLAAIEAFQQGPHPREPGVKIIIEPSPIHEFGRIEPVWLQQVHVVQATRWADLDATIGNLFSVQPESLTVVDLSAIWKRVHRAIIEATSSEAPTSEG